MNIDFRILAGSLIALASLPGCTPIDSGMGSSVRTNLAIQTIDPDPAYKDAATVSGDKTAVAAERYRQDNVKTPRGIRTSSGGTGSGGLGAAAAAGAK